MESSQRSKVNGRTIFGLLFGTYFLFVLYPILRANRPQNDDLIRALSGGYYWDINGRPLTTLIMRTLELNLSSLVDFAPLPQLLAAIFLALAGVLVAQRYRIRSPWLATLLVLPLGAQPFFLENLSFRFDAAAMALSVLLALLPVTALRNTRMGFWAGIVSLLGCLCTYQPALNIFLIFFLLDLIAMQAEQVEPKRLGALACRYGMQLLTAVAIYQWRVAPSIKEWVQEHSQTIRSFREFDVIMANAKAMATFLLDAMAHRWMQVLLPLLALTAIPTVVIGLSYALASRKNHGLHIFTTASLIAFAILAPFLAIACLAGPMLLLRSPIITPRVFPGVGALISAGLIMLYLATNIVYSRRWAAYLPPVFAGIWALAMLTFASIYGNASYAQQQYESRIASQLSDDLAELKAKNSVTRFLLVGSAGLSPLTAHAADGFHVINTLVLPYLSERDFNSRNFMKLYTDMGEIRQPPAKDAAADALLASACSAPVLYTRNRYTLRVIGDTAVVTFPGGRPPVC